MVDFQSRDTRRAPDGDGEDEDEEPADDQHDADGDGDHAHEEDAHDHHHHDADEVGVAVLTVSSSRSLDDDPAGDAVAAAFEADGHEVVTRELVRDSYDTVQGGVDNLASRGDVDVVVTTGGTGVTPDDVTVEAVEPLFDKELPGFGELFRRLSYEEIGAKVVATRATAGVADGVPVFCLPGSEHAAELGCESVVVPEIGHLVGLAGR
ncbi:MogA/MoaB family molybdenum cofactor biosynthesis protein [Halobacterium yunchengense]|uniref:MogA/MoaB family molybdenum cofactor biosynthesis protein n=1 Tax=Halobacterium yunchengense TaxID=3108497 RepID=UPI003008F9E4